MERDDERLIDDQRTGGAPATVLVPQTATVTTSGLTGLAAGAPVTVEGTRGADGTVTATAVTSR